jgi:hypothetical protein
MKSYIFFGCIKWKDYILQEAYSNMGKKYPDTLG